MKATAEKREKNVVTLQVEVEAEQLDAALEKAYNEIVKKVSVPGFRKGKAPRVILERHVGKKAFYDEALEKIIPDAYIKAVKDTGIEPVTQPTLEMVQLEEGKPVVFKATVTVKPEVKLGQYKGVEIHRPKVQVSDEDAMMELEMMRNRHAKMVPVENEPVQEGDEAVIDFIGYVDGKPYEGSRAQDYSLLIGSGTFIPGFEDQLIGMRRGETKEVKVTFPEKYHNKELAGKEAVFNVTVKEVKRKELSPIDDDFAKDVSEFETLEELKQDVKKRLEQLSETEMANEIKQTILDKVIENTEVDIPEEMIYYQEEEMLRTMERQMAAQGFSLEEYLRRTKSTMEDLRARLRPDAEKSMRTVLVLEAIAKQENIEVSEEEIQEELAGMAEYMKQDPAVLRKVLKLQNRLNVVIERIRDRKTIEFLEENAVVNEDVGSPLARPDTRNQTGE